MSITVAFASPSKHRNFKFFILNYYCFEYNFIKANIQSCKMSVLTNTKLCSLDHEFQRQLHMAKILMSTIRNVEDRAIVARYIKKSVALNENDMYVKKNRNEFFRFFLQMLHTASQTQPKVIPQPEKSPDESSINQNDQRKEKNVKMWSKDRRTYTAARVIPGFGVLIYMAVTSDPELGWTQFEIENIQ